MKTKTCPVCREALPDTAFNRASQTRDGRQSICRICASKARAARPPSKREPVRAAIKDGDFETLRKLFTKSKFTLNEMLALAACNYNTAWKHQGHERIVDFLLMKGAQPHWRMLIEPIRAGSQALVDQLLSAGAERNVFVCTAMGDLARLEKLLKRDPSLTMARTPADLRHYENSTPLHFAGMSGLGRTAPAQAKQIFEAGKLLVRHKADVNAIGKFYGYNVTPVDMAAHTGGNLALVEFLIEQGATISSFAFGEALSHRGRSGADGFALAELFLRQGFKINTPYKDGTLLHNAANAGGHESVRWLLEHGADVHALGRIGRTSLHLAAERNTSTKIVEMLLEYGAKLNVKDELGLTPLKVAKQHRKEKVAKWLREKMK